MADIGERKLATIRVIDDLQPIEGADLIEKAVVGGWNVVVKRGELKVGDLCVYCEIDSFLGDGNPAWQFLVDKQPKMFNGKKGHKLRSIKLRGVISQGFVMPLSALPQVTDTTVGTDVTEVLCIEKWEAQLAASLVGQAEGLFPSWGKKTDAERVQNLSGYFESWQDKEFEVTIKLDGSSMSVGVSPQDEFVICSRNLALKLNQLGNTFVDVAIKNNLEEKIRSLGRPIMISGELIGPGIQKNPEMLSTHDFYVFNIWDPLTMTYIPASERIKICKDLGLNHTPILKDSVLLKDLGIYSISDILKYADGPSLNAKMREGVVFKSVDGQNMFKAISNKWLLKNED